MSAPQDIRESVRQRYAEAATQSAAGGHGQARAAETACCGATAVATSDERGRTVFGGELYEPESAEGATADAVAASLGCGVPTAVADLHPGEIVLDLGSGAGADVLISARRVGPGGRVIGLDMTDEMLDLARRNAAEAGAGNVEFLKGYLEEIPLPDDSVDVVISNCVLNLAADKNVVLREAARVLRPGGRLAFSDVIADEGMDEVTKADMAQWTGCIAGALTQPEFAAALETAGLTDIEIRPTHRVHAHAQAAIIRATRPGPSSSAIAASAIVASAVAASASAASASAASASAATASAPKGSSMPTIEVFDPAMCCSTGVCGPTVDPELARFEADLRWLGGQGASVTRYNLAQEPGEFVTRPVVAAMLQSGGEDVLPIVLVDGRLRFSGSRPSRAELAVPLGIEVTLVGANLLAPDSLASDSLAPDCLAPDSDACTIPTEQADTGCCAPAEQSGDACCTPAEKAATECCGAAEPTSAPQAAGSGSCC